MRCWKASLRGWRHLMRVCATGRCAGARRGRSGQLARCCPVVGAHAPSHVAWCWALRLLPAQPCHHLCCEQLNSAPPRPSLPTQSAHPTAPHLPPPPPNHPGPPRPARPPPGFYQRRVAYVRLLGEAYNYRLVDSRLVFATLHLLLGFGYDPGTPPEMTRWARGARAGRGWWGGGAGRRGSVGC